MDSTLYLTVETVCILQSTLSEIAVIALTLHLRQVAKYVSPLVHTLDLFLRVKYSWELHTSHWIYFKVCFNKKADRNFFKIEY